MLTRKEFTGIDRLDDLYDFVPMRHVWQQARYLVHFLMRLAHLAQKSYNDIFRFVCIMNDHRRVCKQMQLRYQFIVNIFNALRDKRLLISIRKINYIVCGYNYKNKNGITAQSLNLFNDVLRNVPQRMTDGIMMHRREMLIKTKE